MEASQNESQIPKNNQSAEKDSNLESLVVVKSEVIEIDSEAGELDIVERTINASA
jgi:hypothetical protein